MQLFRGIRVVVNIHDRLLSFLETQQRAGELTVVSNCGHDAIARQLDGRVRDAQSVIRWRLRSLRLSAPDECASEDRTARPEKSGASHSGQLQELTARGGKLAHGVIS